MFYRTHYTVRKNVFNAQLFNFWRLQHVRCWPSETAGADSPVRQSKHNYRFGRDDHFGKYCRSPGYYFLRGWLVKKLSVLSPFSHCCRLCVWTGGHALESLGESAKGLHWRARRSLSCRGLLQCHRLLHLHVYTGHDKPGEVHCSVLPASIFIYVDKKKDTAPDCLRLVLPSLSTVANIISRWHHRGSFFYCIPGLQSVLLHKCWIHPKLDLLYIFPLLHHHDICKPESVVRCQETETETAQIQLCASQQTQCGIQSACACGGSLLHLLDTLHGSYDLQW